MPTTELTTYFIAERQGGFVLVALALVSLGFAAVLWANRSAFVAMAWPLVVLGSLQLVIGLVVALRTPAQVASRVGLSVGAIYVAKSRVIARLRQEIERLQGDEP